MKDKNSIFAARDEDVTFYKKEKSWYFTGVYVIKINILRHGTELVVSVVHKGSWVVRL